MKAKFIYEAFEKRSKEDARANLLGNNFDKVAADLEKDSGRGDGEIFIYYDKEVISLVVDWKDKEELGWRFEGVIEYDFKEGRSKFTGDAEFGERFDPVIHKTIKPTASYSHQSSDKFNRLISTDDFMKMLKQDRNEVFSYFEYDTIKKHAIQSDTCEYCGANTEDCKCKYN
jgi:hypothetical protein